MPRIGIKQALVAVLLVTVSLFLAIVMRFDVEMLGRNLLKYSTVVAALSVVTIIALWRLDGHRSARRYLFVLTLTSILLGMFNLLTDLSLFPRLVPVYFWLVQVVLVAVVWALVRLGPLSFLRPLPRSAL